MNSVTQVIAFTFMLAFAFGTQILSAVVNTRLTGVGFFKLGTSLVLGSLTFALGLDYYMQPGISPLEWGCYVFLLTSSLIAYLMHRDQKSILMWVIYALQVLAFVVLTFSTFHYQQNWIIFFLLTMGLLGISNFSMILGHYYLVVPKLSEEPLIYCLNILWTVIFLKITIGAATLLGPGWNYLQEGTMLGDGYMYNWLFISMRILWGYVAPLILSFFTYRLCRLRSIQSATGVLYIIEFFVIVGEIISVYLMTKHGLIV
jgi:hypothetical protein